MIQALELYGCMFPGFLCCTHTMTNGNALGSLISFVFQHIALTRSYKVMYQHVCEKNNDMNYYSTN